MNKFIGLIFSHSTNKDSVSKPNPDEEGLIHDSEDVNQ
jgi:hypothetical protein